MEMQSIETNMTWLMNRKRPSSTCGDMGEIKGEISGRYVEENMGDIGEM